MPFTFSHPAAVLPLTFLPRRWFSLTGLVIGSMAPDFEYFIRMKVHSSYSHTWTGVLLFDLPLAVLLSFIFHIIVRNDLIDNLPPVFKSRLAAFLLFQWTDYFKSNVFVVLLSSIFGTITHVIWDSFTHLNGHSVEAIGGLQDTLVLVGHEVPVYKILQHTSTIVGGLSIVYALFRLPVVSLTKTQTRQGYWLSVTVTTLTVIAFRVWLGQSSNFIGNIIVTAIAGGLIGLILTPQVLRVTQNGR